MQLRSILTTAALAATAFAQTYPIRLIYQFANDFTGADYVNIENVAIRRTNGQLLLNFVTNAVMGQLDPSNPVPKVLINITSLYPGAPGSLTGIAETGRDTYTVAAGNFVFGPQVPGGVNGVLGSFSLWSVDLTGHEAKANKIVDIPEAQLLNGIATVKGYKDYVLVAESVFGRIYKVNIKTGAYEIFSDDPLLLPNEFSNFGVNGLEAQGDYLYLTNSAASFFGAIKLGPGLTAASGVHPFVYAPQGSGFDDFALDGNGNAWIATQPNAVNLATRESEAPITIAGGTNDSVLLGPTSAALKGSTLYVVTGGQGGPMPQSGQVFAIEVSDGSGKTGKRWTA